MSTAPPKGPAPTPPGVPPPPPERYRLALVGGGTEEVDRIEVKNRIRRGELVDSTQIALAGSDEWRATSTFPELQRYLALAAESRRVVAVPVQAPRATSGEVASM